MDPFDAMSPLPKLAPIQWYPFSYLAAVDYVTDRPYNHRVYVHFAFLEWVHADNSEHM